MLFRASKFFFGQVHHGYLLVPGQVQNFTISTPLSKVQLNSPFQNIMWLVAIKWSNDPKWHQWTNNNIHKITIFWYCNSVITLLNGKSYGINAKLLTISSFAIVVPLLLRLRASWWVFPLRWLNKYTSDEIWNTKTIPIQASRWGVCNWKIVSLFLKALKNNTCVSYDPWKKTVGLYIFLFNPKEQSFLFEISYSKLQPLWLFAWKVSLKIMNSGLILKTFTHESWKAH